MSRARRVECSSPCHVSTGRDVHDSVRPKLSPRDYQQESVLMRTIRVLAVAVCFLILGAEHFVTGAEPSADWTPVTGQWSFDREIVPIVCQGSETGSALILAPSKAEPARVCRAIVRVSAGTAEAGLWLDAEPQAERGIQILLGRCSNVGGFMLRTAKGETLWEDRFAPWNDYGPYVLEGVLDGHKLRVQMFEGTGDRLISQSPWIDLDEEIRLTGSSVGLFTTDGRARFLRVERNVPPLSDLVADPPNKRRLQNEQASWDLLGDGQWMWTTAERQRVRQYAASERSWAVCRDLTGTHRVWECRVKVDRGTAGTGMYFLYRNEDDKGFLAWLGGTHGAGAFMLYGHKPTPKALWASPQDRWHWDTEYLLRAESNEGQIRIQQLAADGATVIADSNWIKVDSKYTDELGCLGLHTWKGPADFWGFTGEAAAPTATSKRSAADALGTPWLTRGDGKWNWVGQQRMAIVQAGPCRQAVALTTERPRSLGTSSCFVRKSPEAKAAGVVFQADKHLANGFLALMTDDGPRLETLGGKVLWQADRWTADTNREVRLEGVVMTDRVSMRVYDGGDPSRLLITSPDVYVPETNNSRLGHSGMLARGAAEFRCWGKGWFTGGADR